MNRSAPKRLGSALPSIRPPIGEWAIANRGAGRLAHRPLRGAQAPKRSGSSRPNHAICSNLPDGRMPTSRSRRNRRMSFGFAVGGATSVGCPVRPCVANRALVHDHHVDVRVVATVAEALPLDVATGGIEWRRVIAAALDVDDTKVELSIHRISLPLAQTAGYGLRNCVAASCRCKCGVRIFLSARKGRLGLQHARKRTGRLPN
jgi:hypothetical protein